MTGCSGLLACHEMFALPMLHDVVPSEIASMPATDGWLPTSLTSPTITSGPMPCVHCVVPGWIRNEPGPPSAVTYVPIWNVYVVPSVALNCSCDCTPHTSSLQFAVVPAGQPL